MSVNILSEELFSSIDTIYNKCELKSPEFSDKVTQTFSLKKQDYFTLTDNTINDQQCKYKLIPKYLFKKLYNRIEIVLSKIDKSKSQNKPNKSIILDTFTDDIYGIWVYMFYTPQIAKFNYDELKYSGIKLDGNNIDDFIKNYIEYANEFKPKQQVICHDKVLKEQYEDTYKLTEPKIEELNQLAIYLKSNYSQSKMNEKTTSKNNKFSALAINEDILLDSDNEINTSLVQNVVTTNQSKTNENKTENNENKQGVAQEFERETNKQDAASFEPIMSKKIIKLISEKHNIPMDNKELNKILKVLEKRECNYKKLDKSILNGSKIQKDKLSSFGIKDINKEIIDALCNPNYNADNLKPLSDIELYTDYVDNTSYNTKEYQLISFLKWCVIYADYKSYIVTNTIYKTINNFKFKSTDFKEVINEIKELDNELFNKVSILAYNFSGGNIQLRPKNSDESVRTESSAEGIEQDKLNMNINWCNKFMENRLIKIIMPTNKKNKTYNYWCKFLDNPIKVSKSNNDFRSLEETDPYYYNFLVQLFNYHSRIAEFRINPVIMPHEKCNEHCSAFAQSLLSYQYNKVRNINNIMDENHKDYYMKNDISERITCMYKLCSFDIDINKNTFELPKLKQDLTFIIDYLLKPIDDIKIYYAIDINKTINSALIINELDSLIANDPNKTHKHRYKYWSLEQSKDVSIHIYVSGVYFTDMQLFGLGRIILQAINSYHLFYIDASTFKTGSQQFRCPFSGKMACGRKPVPRVNERYSKEDLIKFYKHCSVYPTKDDKYCDKFECFMEHCDDKCRKKQSIKNATPVSVFTANNKKTVRKVKNLNNLYNLHPVEFDKPTQLLIDMMIKTVQKIFNYIEHRSARLILLNNVIALGGNMANILEINAELGIQHSNKTTTVNTQNNDDCNWVMSKSGENTTEFKYNRKLLYKDKKPIVFPMNNEIKKILFETPLPIDIANILAQHYYAFVDSKHVYYFDTILNQFTGQPEITLKGPFSTPFQMTSDKFNIYAENGMVSINPYHYFSSPNITMYRYNTVGFCDNPDCLNTYPLDIPKTKDNKSFDELYKTYPEFYKLLFRIFNDDELEKPEVDNRITYFMTAICYAIQNPQRVKPKGLLINTQNSAGKTQLMNIFKDCFNELVLTGKTLDCILSDRFNGYMINKVIVCCEELKPNQDYEILKKWMDEPAYPIEQKGKELVCVPNTSIKIFYSNNKHFNFIKEKDRRFIVFRSSIIYPNNIEPEIAKIFKQSEYRIKFINYLKDYLINYDTKDFDPNDANLIPKSCIDEYNSICENNDANENYNVGFIKQIFKSCITPTFAKDNKKCMTSQHILDIINLMMKQCKLNYKYDYLEDYEKILFVNQESYDELYDFVLSHYEPEKQKWFVNKITKILANEQHFTKHFYRKQQLNIPEIINQKYNSDRIKIIKYLL